MSAVAFPKLKPASARDIDVKEKPAEDVNTKKVTEDIILKPVSARQNIKHLDAPTQFKKPEWARPVEEDNEEEVVNTMLQGEFPLVNNAAKESDHTVDPSFGQFYHGALSEPDAEALIRCHPKAKSGTFLFRDGHAKGYYICSTLEIARDGIQHRILHNKVTPNQKNPKEFDVNGRPWGITSLAELSKDLQKRQPGWNVALSNGVIGYKILTDAMLEAESMVEAEAKAKEAQEVKEKELAELTEFRKKQMVRRASIKEMAIAEAQQAEKVKQEILESTVREREVAKRQLKEQKKQKAIEAKRQELIVQKAKEFDGDLETLNTVLENATVNKTDDVKVDSDSDSDDEGPTSEDVEVWKPVQRRGSFNKSGGTAPIFLHGPMDAIEAYGWLNDGGAVDGKFLIRSIKKKPSNYYIDYVERGRTKSAHVSQSTTAFFKEFAVDGKSTGTTTIESLITLLTNKFDWWSCPLKRELCVPPNFDKKESKRVKKLQKAIQNSK